MSCGLSVRRIAGDTKVAMAYVGSVGDVDVIGLG